MSATTSSRRKETAPAMDTPAAAPASDAANAAALEALATVVVEIAGLNVTLPLKFRPGHVLTENQAKILDAAYQRQFTNNQNANAKSRTEKLSKATTDAERAASAPLSADAIAALYTDYEPAVGGGTRQSSLDKLKQEQAWRFWTGLVAEHNKSVAAGGTPVIAKAGTKQVTISQPPRKGKDQPEADAKAAREAFDAERGVFIGRLLEHSVYGPRIAAMVEAEIEARKIKAPSDATGDDVAVSGEGLI